MPESAGTLFVDISANSGGLDKSLADLGIAMQKLGEKFDGSTKKIQSNLDKVDAKLKSVSAGFNKVGKAMTTYVTLPIVAAGAAAIKFGSDYQESLNKVDVAFGNSAQSVIDWSNTTLTSIGLAKGTALDMAAGIGDMATSMGFAKDQAADMGKELVGRAADLASFKNISIDVANTALKGVFTGETESLKTLGVVMTQANLEAYALSQGIQTNIKDMSESEKVALRYSFVLDKTSNSAGDFARTSDGAANQMRIFQESMKELATNFGQIILPLFTRVVTKVNEFVQWFGALSEGTKKTILVIAGLVAVVGPLLLVFAKIVTAVRVLIPVMTALNAIVAANPFILIVLAIGAVIGALVLLYKNFDLVKTKIAAFWTSFKFYALQAFTIVSAGILKFAEYFLKAFEIINAPIFLMLNKMIEAFNAISGKNIPTLTAVFSKATDALNGMSKKQIENFKEAAEEHKIATQKEIEAEKNKNAEFKKAIDENEKMTDEQIAKQEAKFAEQRDKSVAAEREHQKTLMEIRQEAFNNALQIAQQLTSQTSAIFDQYYKNRSITLDNDQKREEDAVKKSAMTEEQKQAALDKIAAKYDKKRKKLQRDQAKQQKVMSIFNATIATAQAVSGALGNFPWSPANIALAAVMGALGAAQIGLIASQPLPELASGGLTTGTTQAIIGEAGQEAVIPLTNQSSLDAIASALAPALAARLAVYNQPQNTTVVNNQAQLLPEQTSSNNNNNLVPINLDTDILWNKFFKASQNGQVFIDKRALV